MTLNQFTNRQLIQNLKQAIRTSLTTFSKLAFAILALSLVAEVSFAQARSPIGSDEYPAPSPGANYGQQLQRRVILNHRVITSRIQLFALFEMGPEFHGYQVDGLIINLRGSNAQMALLVNGQAQAVIQNPFGSVRLSPASSSLIGRDIQNLELDIRGFADVDNMVLLLTAPSPSPVPTPQDIYVPIAIHQLIFSGSRLDVTQFIDMNSYRGMQITGIDISANSSNRTAYLSTLVNGHRLGQDVMLTKNSPVFSLYPQNTYLGDSNEALVFYADGDLQINSVTLRLSR